MNAITDTITPLPVDDVDFDPYAADVERVLVLVQDYLVISTFPDHQVENAIDLARVLSRALAQPVDVFRRPRSDVENVQVGASVSPTHTHWILLAHVRVSLFSGVVVELHDPGIGVLVADH